MTGASGAAQEPITLTLNGQTFTVSPLQANETCQGLKTAVDAQVPEAAAYLAPILSRGRISDEAAGLGQVAIGIADASCPEFSPPPSLVDQLNAASP